MRYLVFAAVLLVCGAAVGDEYQLLHFEAAWCGPCRLLKTRMGNKKFKDVIKQHKITVTDIDTDADPESTAAYEVSEIPLCVLVVVNSKKEARVLKRQVGLMTVDELVKFAEPPKEAPPK